jgi:hypothetical protein
MATGAAYQPGGVAAPSDVPYAGAAEWAGMTGVHPSSPLVGAGGGGNLPYNVDGSRSRVITTESTMTRAADDPGLAVLDTWRDVFNFRGSPAPWILLLALVMLGLMQLRISARAGKARGNIALG